MPISPDQQKALKTLGLKKGSELYTLAKLLVETQGNPAKKRRNVKEIKEAWDVAIEAFTRVVNLGETEQGEKTPFSLLMHLSHWIQNPIELANAIQEKVKTSANQKATQKLKKQKPSLDIGIFYASELYYAAMLALTNEKKILTRTPKQQNACKEFWGGILQTTDQDAILALSSERLFECLQHICSHDEPPFKSSLNKIANSSKLDFNAANLTSKKTVCELAVLMNHKTALETFIPKTHCETHYNALILALKLNRADMVDVLRKCSPELVEHLANHRQDLLQDYYTYHSSPNLYIIGMLLDAGCVYKETKMLKELLTQESSNNGNGLLIQKTRDFLNAADTNTLEPLKVLEELETHNIPILNARDKNGNTIFYILFDALMQKDASHFEHLVFYIQGFALNLYLKNNAGLNLYSLPYLTETQKHYIQLADAIQKTQYIWLNKKSFSNDSSFTTRLQELRTLLEKLPSETTLTNLKHYFCLKIWLVHFLQAEDTWKLLPEASLYTEKVQTMVQNPQTKYHFQGISFAFKFSLDKKRFPIISALLRMNGPIDYIDLSGSLLHGIIQSKDMVLIDLITNKLTQCPQSLVATDKFGNTPLHAAFMNNMPSAFILSLISALEKQNKNMNILNKEGFSPLYYAISNNRIAEGFRLLQSKGVSVIKQESPAKSLFMLWMKKLNEQPIAPERKKELEDSVKFGLLLLQKGCYYPIDNPEFLKLRQVLLGKFEQLSDLEDSSDVWDEFEETLTGLQTAWKQMGKITCEAFIPFSEVPSPLPWKYMDTRLNGKTMFETIQALLLSHQTQLQGLAAKHEQGECSEAEQKRLQELRQMIEYNNTILSMLIFQGASFVSTDENHKLCAQIANKIKGLQLNLESSNEILQKMQENTIKENSLSQEAKASLAYFKQLREPALRRQGEEIFAELQGLDDNQYWIFKACCYSLLADKLFAVDAMNNLDIPTQTLKLVQQSIKRAMALVEKFKSYESAYGVRIIELHAKISPFLKTETPYDHLRTCLRLSELAKREPWLKTNHQNVYDQATFLLCPDLDKVFQGFDVEIPETLRKKDEEIAKLRAELDEATPPSAVMINMRGFSSHRDEKPGNAKRPKLETYGTSSHNNKP